MKKYLVFIILFLSSLLLIGCLNNNKYKITFVTNCYEKIRPVYIEIGEKIKEPKELSKANHTFIGWFYEDTIWNFDTDIPTNDITLEAKWTMGYGIVIKGDHALYVGDVFTYTFDFTPYDDYIASYGVTWSVSDESCATINSETGELKALKETEQLYIYVKSNWNSKFFGRTKIVIRDENPYPNLNGYTIKIAIDEHNINTKDSFSEFYIDKDNEIKQQVWSEIERNFNCNIELVGKDAFEDNITDFDFILTNPNELKNLVDKDKIIDTSDFYLLYGNDCMNEAQINAGTYKGKLYSINLNDSLPQNVLYYNVNCLRELQKHNPNLKEPAEIFLEENWTIDTFVSYCEEVQNTFKLIYGDKGTRGNENQEYYAITGNVVLWWIGLSSLYNEPLADDNLLINNLASDYKEEMANLLKDLYGRGIAEDYSNFNSVNPSSWISNKSLFNVGELYYTKIDSYWPIINDFGYVPWPRANNSSFEEMKIALSGNEEFYCMPKYKDYSNYGEECTPENIYWAFALLFNETKDIYKFTNAYKEDLEEKVNKYSDTEASRKALLYAFELIENNEIYYDPIFTNHGKYTSCITNVDDNKIYITDTIYNYCVTNKLLNFKDAINQYNDKLQKLFRDNI